ncbi:hypothetical protein D1007_23955 [Hordeum vulgare]|nr:hypothetical protein D1007_23955 [Hordeum vulgare]
MSRFRRFLANEVLRDIYLHERRYTWFSERDASTLTRIDQVLSNSEWEAIQPHCMLRCLSSAASDHAPLLLYCTASSSGTRRFHIERFWPHTDGYLQAVKEAWAISELERDPFWRLVARLKATAWHLQSWSAKKIGDVSRQLLIAREQLTRLKWAATQLQLKGAYQGLASLERSISRQRMKFSWLQDGDAGPKFFRVHAGRCKQKKCIIELQVGHTSA